MKVFAVLFTTAIGVSLLSDEAVLHFLTALWSQNRMRAFWVLAFFAFTWTGRISGNLPLVLIWSFCWPRSCAIKPLAPWWSRLLQEPFALIELKRFMNSYSFESVGCPDSSAKAAEVFTSCHHSCRAEQEHFICHPYHMTSKPSSGPADSIERPHWKSKVFLQLIS